MGQAGVCRLPHFTSTGGLVVQLQCQLNISGRLGTLNLAYGCAQAHVRCVQLYVVKGVDEVGPELQFEALGDLEVLCQSQINVGVMRPAQPAELRSAISKGSDRRIGE